jgi:hypothetical protein
VVSVRTERGEGGFEEMTKCKHSDKFVWVARNIYSEELVEIAWCKDCGAIRKEEWVFVKKGVLKK